MNNVSLLSSSTYLKPVRLLIKVTYKMQTDKSNTTGKWLRNELVSMGSTYIKMGQLVASRTDLFPTYLTEELDSLKDDVPPVPMEDISSVFFTDFHKHPLEIFETFEETPIGSASIAQVHLATLRNGKEVVVKVQKPNVRYEMIRELDTLSTLLSFMETIIPIKQVKDIAALIYDLSTNLTEETDFENESANMKLFYEMFKKSNNIIIPRVYSKILSTNVLVMEYIPGKSLKDMNRNNSELANTLMSEFIQNTLTYGILHGDPHSGNVAFLSNDKIVLYDFGSIAKYDACFREAFQQMFKAVLTKDIDLIITTMINNKIIIFNRSCSSIYELDANEYVTLYSILTYILDYARNPNIQILSSKLKNDIFIDQNNIPFVFNPRLLLMFKSFATLEGVCKEISNDFSYDGIISVIIMDMINFEFINERVQYDMNSLRNPKTNEKLSEYKMMLIQQRNQSNHNNIHIALVLFVMWYIM